MGTGGNISIEERRSGLIRFEASSLVAVPRILYLQRAILGNYAEELTTNTSIV
jgi:hypothetical protein